MRKKRLPIISTVIIIILTGSYLLARPSLSRLSVFLSKSGKVSGNILIIEGWLPVKDLQTAVDEFRNNGYEYIVTTGLRATPEYYNVNTDGNLIFYVRNLLPPDNKASVHSIEVNAYSELDGENSAHFKFWVNDSVSADFSIGRHKRKYGILWKGDLQDIDSVIIQFDNDMRGDFGDRNLFVKEVIFDKKVSIPFLNNSVYQISYHGINKRIINDITSNSEMTARRLMALGIDSSLIIPISGHKVRINRTLTSALAFRDWLRKSGIKVTGINIISAGAHARRTWMTFNTVLKNSVNIGIISLPDNTQGRPKRIRLMKLIRESLAYLYYSVILIPY
jgi:hypothetical protein